MVPSRRRPAPAFAAAVLVLVSLAGRLAADQAEVPARGTRDQEERPEVQTFVPRRPWMGDFSERYSSYAHTGYENYDTFLGARPWHYIYDSFGDLQMGGEELYSWVQHTTTEHVGQNLGDGPISSQRHSSVFDRIIAIGRVDQNGRAARVIITPSPVDGTSFYDDGIITRYSPSVLNQIGIQGVRSDFSTLSSRMSMVVGTRYRQHRQSSNTNANDSAILLGGRVERDIGTLTFGASLSNQHTFDFRRDLGGLRGDLQSSQAVPAVIAVRISDDSREDAGGGPDVFGVRVFVNGQERPDIVPGAVRQSFANDFTAVGRTSFTGTFLRDLYYDPELKRISDEYRGLEIPLFADYFYVRDYLESPEDDFVATNTDLTQLLESMEPISPATAQRAAGDDYLMYYVDLEGEPHVTSVRIDFLVANDYRIEVAGLDVVDPTQGRYQGRYSSPFFETVRRAAGRVTDGSNLEWVSVPVGVNTGQTLYGVDLKGQVGSVQVRGEVARGTTHYRYPDGVPGSQVERLGEGPVLRDWNGERYAVSDEALYLTVSQDEERYGFGVEAFSVGPNYTVQMRLRPGDQSLSYNPRYLYQQIKNGTTFLNLIDDNDDYDARVETVLRGTLREPDRAVFPAQDDNNDGIPDNNRNLNELPDYLEPFLMYDTDPNDFDWGLDLNNNGEIDIREDDLDPDLPYDRDLRGVHAFGRAGPAEGLDLTLGFVEAGQIDGGGRFDVRYAGLSYRRERPGLGWARLESEVKRVRDSVANDVLLWSSSLQGEVGQATQELIRLQRFYFTPDYTADPLDYRNSVVSRSFAHARVTLIPGVRLESKVKLEVNRQLEIDSEVGAPQDGSWLRFLALSAKADYTWSWESVSVTPKIKYRVLRETRSGAGKPLADERSLIPIVEARWHLTDRSVVKAGVQGLPFLEFRARDHVDPRNSFQQRTYLLVLSNRSTYAGYNLSTNIGLNRERRRFTDSFRHFENTNATGLFVRAFLGFAETTLY